MFEIIPSPGTEMKEWSEMEKRIEIIRPFAKTIHIDVVDGKFADNVTFRDPKPFQKYTKDIFFEVHLMVDDPIQYLSEWADAGFRRFIGHVERMPDQYAFITKAMELGEVGLALDGKTGLDTIAVPYIDLDTLLIMTINAGFSGQNMIPEALEKVKTLSYRNELPVEIDGGVNIRTIGHAVQKGARRFVCTSAIFNTEEPKKAYEDLYEECLTAYESVSAIEPGEEKTRS